VQDTTDTAAAKMEMVLMAESRCQHHSGLWPFANSSAISPARIAAKPFPPCYGLSENEAVAAGDFTGVRYLASNVFVPTKTRNCGSRRCRKPQFLLVGVAPQTP